MFGRLLAPLSAAALLAACAGAFGIASLPPGASGPEVLERFGRPTRVVPLAAGGQRLQYSLQPAGHEAWMVDLDAAGRVQRVRQVMQLAEFHRIVPGEWTRQDVEREFGPPAQEDRVASWAGPVLTYRWRDFDRTRMYYWVYLDGGGVVRRAHQGMEIEKPFPDPVN